MDQSPNQAKKKVSEFWMSRATMSSLATPCCSFSQVPHRRTIWYVSAKVYDLSSNMRQGRPAAVLFLANSSST